MHTVLPERAVFVWLSQSFKNSGHTSSHSVNLFVLAGICPANCVIIRLIVYVKLCHKPATVLWCV